MAIDASKVRRRLPTPPPPEDGAPGIERPPEPVAAPQAQAAEPEPDPVLDGRSLRATGRTMQLNIKATVKTKTDILRIAKQQGWLVSEVVEHAVAALVEKHKTDK